jgi:asparagine synthetase B (glutamine-hydrolysing)
VPSVFSKPTHQRQLSLIYDAISLISPSYYRERFCVDVAYPFLDQDVVEFLLAVPTDQKMRPGEPRSLQRRSMRPYLPAQIHSRRGKRGPDEAVYRSMARNHGWISELAKNSLAAQRGYLAPKGFADAVNAACHGADVQAQPLVRALALEMWLRSHERWSRTPQSCALPFQTLALSSEGRQSPTPRREEVKQPCNTLPLK